MRLFYFLLTTVLIFGCSGKVDEPRRSIPNIVLIMADDLGYETIVANGGSSYQTPEIDGIAARGIRFEHCYAQPLCTPSRIQIMTGIYNVRNYVRFGLLDQGQHTFGHILQNAGYATCVVGKWQLGKNPMSPRMAGFEQHCLWQVRDGRTDSLGRDTRFLNPVLETNGKLIKYQDGQYGPDLVSDFALDFINQSVKSEKPFFLYYPMILTHCPFSPTPQSPEWITDDTTIMTYKGQPRYFDDMVQYMDRVVGKIVNHLNENGISDNTLVIFTGDNGTDKPIESLFNGQIVAGAKGESTDAGTRVPLIMQWPDVIEPGTVCQDLVDFTDFVPTFCDLIGVSDIDSLGLDGQSFLPQLTGQTSDPREWIYSWYARGGEDEKARVFARDHEYKLYRTGEFYQIPTDPKEKIPLDFGRLNGDQLGRLNKLQAVIDHYDQRIGENIN